MRAHVPDWYEAVLLALASYRVFRLIAYDTILDRPRNQILARLDEKWEKTITCPFCAGWWITVAWWAAWLAAGDWTLVAATPWAIHGAWVLVATNLDPEHQD